MDPYKVQGGAGATYTRSWRAASMKEMLPWRQTPGYYRAGESTLKSIQSLFSEFLRDRHSPSSLEKYYFKDDEKPIDYDWGESQPLELVINNEEDLDRLMKSPFLYRQSICIVEPADHVGFNTIKEPVRASTNIAWLAQRIADCDSIVFPLWKSGLMGKDKLKHALTSSLMIVFEGGHPTVRDSSSFDNSKCSHSELLSLCEELILSRNLRSAPSLFICLGHQLAAQAHIELIKKAVCDILKYADAILYDSPNSREALKQVCNRITFVGKNLRVVKQNKTVASGWDDLEFAVAINEVPEAGHCELVHYEKSGCHPDPELAELLTAQSITAEEYDGVIEESISYEKDLNIVMFHTDEVNEEAILFANWAYRALYQALLPARKQLVISPIAWIFNLPSSIEILCSTTAEGKICTEVAATCISYRDYDTRQTRRSFTCQFHPELRDDLREFRKSGIPSYEYLKRDDGIRLLVRILYESLME